MRIAIACVLATATSANASQIPAKPKPKPIASMAHGGRVASQRVEPIDDDHAKLELVLATNARVPTEVSVPISVPDHFVVTGLVLASSDVTEELVGVERVVDSARGSYEMVVEQMRDPAIVEWTDKHHVMLRVFPVQRGTNAKLTVELTRVGADHAARVSENMSIVAVPEWARTSASGVTIAASGVIDTGYSNYWPMHDDPSIGTYLPSVKEPQ
jgi:hypothetical protein